MSDKITWSSSSNHVDWHELAHLYRIAGFKDKSASILKTTFDASAFKWFARHDGWLVAAGRALVERADRSYICDLTVAPTHRGGSLVRELVRRLIEDSTGYGEIFLHATPGLYSQTRKLEAMVEHGDSLRS